MNSSFVLTGIMLIPITIVALVFGLLGLKLIAVVFNGIAGHRRPHHIAQRGSVSGTFAGLLGGVSVLALVAGVVFLAYARTGEVPWRGHSVVTHDRTEAAASLREAMHDLSEARGAVHEAVATIPVGLEEAPAADGTHGTDETNANDATAVSKEIPAAGTTDAATIAEPPVVDPEMKARSEQLAQLATTIGQLVRSRLDHSGEKKPSDQSSPDGKAADSDVVVFQLSEEVVQQLLGESGRELLQSFNSELPDRIRQTYALIPLTPPVGGPVSPVKPLLRTGSLEAIANSLVSLVDIAEPATVAPSAEETAVVLTTAPELRPMPDWVKKPDGRRIVAETEPILPLDDAQQPLTEAINRALADHLASVTQSINPALRAQTRFVKLELSDMTAQRCVIEKFVRVEVIETAAEGPQAIRKVYALLEFPESVDKAAIRELRRSAQHDRVAGLGFVIGCAWLSIASAGFGIRLWRKGTRLRRWSVVPVFAVVSLPLLAVAAGTILTFSQGETVRPPWNQNPDVVRIDLRDAA